VTCVTYSNIFSYGNSFPQVSPSQHRLYHLYTPFFTMPKQTAQQKKALEECEP